jgi:hypothetical protein
VPGTVIADEGIVLKAVLIGNTEHAAIAGAGAGEVIIGFAHDTTVTLDSKVEIEDGLVVPSTGAVTIQLAHGNLISGSVRVHDVTGNADLAIGTDVTVNVSTGLLTFTATQKGKAVIVTYRRNLTVRESQQLFFGRPTNFSSPADGDNAIFLAGDVEIYTDMYDTAVSYDGVTELYVTAGGLLTSVATGHTKVPGRVLQLPTAADPFIGYAARL